MPLAKEIGSHHTMWITVGQHRPVAVRYAVDKDEVICFGDRALRDVGEGATVLGTVHDIAGGQPLVGTSFDVRVMASGDVPMGIFGEVLGHVRPVGSWADERLSRRFLGLRVHGTPRAA
jgi:hypothetical protein